MTPSWLWIIPKLDDRGGRKQLKRLLVMSRRFVDKTETLFCRSLFVHGVVKTLERELAELTERLAATEASPGGRKSRLCRNQRSAASKSRSAATSV